MAKVLIVGEASPRRTAVCLLHRCPEMGYEVVTVVDNDAAAAEAAKKQAYDRVVKISHKTELIEFWPERLPRATSQR